MPHIHPTQAAGAAYFGSSGPEGITMLNLLRFKPTADFSASPELAPDSPISGAAAYRLYAAAVMPLLAKAGSQLVYQGKCHPFLIGPETERWDMMLLVQHKNKASFLAFSQDPDYLKIAGYRTAALEDARLLPIDPT